MKNKFNEMKYTGRGEAMCLLSCGSFKGRNYVICNRGGMFPVAYVEALPEDPKLYDSSVELGDDFRHITFGPESPTVRGVKLQHLYWGWSYSQEGDAMNIDGDEIPGKEYTEEDVYQDVLEFILRINSNNI